MSGVSRRAILRALPAVALPAVAVAATAPHADAALIALKADFDRAHGKLAALRTEHDRLESVFTDLWQRQTGVADGRVTTATWKAWCALRIECGYEASVTALNDATGAVDPIATAIRDKPAKTLVGLAIKARATAFMTHHLSDFGHYHIGDDEWADEAAVALYEACEAAAAGLA